MIIEIPDDIVSAFSVAIGTPVSSKKEVHETACKKSILHTLARAIGEKDFSVAVREARASIGVATAQKFEATATALGVSNIDAPNK